MESSLPKLREEVFQLESQKKTLEKAGDTAAVPVILAVTAKGRALYKTVLPVAQRNQARLLQKLTRDERRTLYSVLSKLFSAIGTQERDDDE